MRLPRRWLAILLTVSVCAPVAGCGNDDHEPEGANARRFNGEQKRVAAVVDDLEAASRAGDAQRICDDLFTDKLAGVISVRAGGSCEDQVRRRQVRRNARITVLRLEVAGGKAGVDVEEQNGNRTTLVLTKREGGWRIDSISATARPQK